MSKMHLQSAPSHMKYPRPSPNEFIPNILEYSATTVNETRNIATVACRWSYFEIPNPIDIIYFQLVTFSTNTFSLTIFNLQFSRITLLTWNLTVFLVHLFSITFNGVNMFYCIFNDFGWLPLFKVQIQFDCQVGLWKGMGALTENTPHPEPKK